MTHQVIIGQDPSVFTGFAWGFSLEKPAGWISCPPLSPIHNSFGSKGLTDFSQ
jgi:hypothetical protein